MRNFLTLASLKNHSTSKQIAVIASFAFLTLSLFFTAFTITDGDSEDGRTVLSLEALLSGWYGVLTLDAASISWLANPLWLFSITQLDKHRNLAFLFSVIAVIASASFLLANEVIANEGGGKREILTINTGYYLWILGQIVTCLVLFGQVMKRQSPEDQ